MKKISLLFILAFLLTACPMDSYEIIWVKNNSNQTIVVTAEYILPDTLLMENPAFLKVVDVNQNIGINASDYLNDRYLDRMKKGEKLTLFVLSKDSVDSYLWKYIRENNVILKRYEFDWAELQLMGNGGKTNRTITYP